MKVNPNAGFTLIELVLSILLIGILGAVALPRMVDLSSDARVAAVNGLAGALQQAANNVRLLCATNVQSGCDLNSSGWFGSIKGKKYRLNYGWPDAGDELNDDEIDNMVNYSGFTAQLTNSQQTYFSKDGAPDPMNCGVAYFDAYSVQFAGKPFGTFAVVVKTSGC